MYHSLFQLMDMSCSYSIVLEFHIIQDLDGIFSKIFSEIGADADRKLVPFVFVLVLDM